MKPVDQTILHNDPYGRIGNCLQACVASITEQPLDQVPHFAESDTWELDMLEWLTLHGYQVTIRPYIRHSPAGIAWGLSPRGVTHAVVVEDGEVAFDPHPSRAGLDRTDGIWDLESDQDE